MIALNILNAFTHDHKLIVLIYILEAGPAEVAVYCDRNTYVLKQLLIQVMRCVNYIQNVLTCVKILH